MRNKKISRWICWLIPAIMYGIGETVTGNLFSIGWIPMLLNLVIYYFLYLGVLAIWRTTKYGWPLLNLVLYFLAMLEYFVISFRERPAMFWDVLAFRTAMTVSANYNFSITPTLIVTGCLTVVLGILAWKRPWIIGSKEETSKKRFGRIAVWGSTWLMFLWVLFETISPKYHLEVPMWDPVVSFEKEGFLLSTVLSFRAVIPPKPEGYSKEMADELLAQIKAKSDGDHETDLKGTTMPTNVICIMNESFSDLRQLQGVTGDGRFFETDQPFLEYFDSLSEAPNTQKGNLYVPVFGAMTANSEYEVLTGNSCAFVPQGSIPYQFYTKPGDESLAKIFRNLGYETVAMHPYPGYNWNRTEAYENLGFDTFLDLEFYENLEQEMEMTKPREYLSDRSDYDAILHLLKEKDADEKLFLFNVTMQNHGGFEVEGLESAVHVTELNGENCKGQYPKADQYLTLIRMSDEALEYFLAELEQIEEPTMVVLFGDHQPSVETEFFEALYGMRWADIPGELKLNSFKTPYLIWTNYERMVEDAGDMSAFMLGHEILKAAGVEPSGLFAAAGELREYYDAVHAMGVLKKEGSFSDSQTTEVFTEEIPILHFHTIQYYEIFE